MSSRNKGVVFAVIVIALCAFVAILIWRSSRNSSNITNMRKAMATESYSQPASSPNPNTKDLEKPQMDLLGLVNQKTGQDMSESYNQFLGVVDVQKMMAHAHEEMDRAGIDSAALFLGGETMAEPVQKIARQNPKLFMILGKTEVLKFMGRVLTTTFWAMNAKKPSPDSLMKCWGQSTNIDWDRPESWSNPTQIIAKHCQIS